jgi:hypothetical protein
VDDGERVTLTTGQAKRLLLGLSILTLILVGVATALRAGIERSDHPASADAGAFGRPGSGSGSGSGSGRTEHDAGWQRGTRILLGGGGTYTDDPSALNKSIGEPVELWTKGGKSRVTPARVGAGAAGCAAGPVVTVDLRVKSLAGTMELPLNDFVLLASDGSLTLPIPECSTGFADASAERTIAFASADLDRLVFATDPTDPLAVWHLP